MSSAVLRVGMAFAAITAAVWHLDALYYLFSLVAVFGRLSDWTRDTR